MRAWIDRVVSILKRATAPLCGGALVLLAGCGGGDGSVGVGQGQEPDPVAPDFAIAYTKGPLFDEDDELQQSTDLRSLERCNVGTDLYMKDRASPTAVERNITFRVTNGEGDVQGVEISQDGKKVLFAMRTPCPDDLEDPPTWDIWEYEIAADALRRIIASDITNDAGQDISPHYLPDGRIVFTSTRQRTSKAILLDEGKPQFEAFDEDRDEPAYVLHVMDADGENMRQISFNQSNDYDPTVLENGKIMFSRWDHAGGVNGIHLYQMNPDGSGLELLYGAESHATGTNNSQVQFVSARETMDGKIMAVVRPFDQEELGGAITIIDVPTYVENTQPLAAFPGMTGPAQVAATPNQVRTDDLPSQGGRFSSAFPLWDGTDRVLVSWAICRLEEPDPANPTDPEAVVYVPCTDERLAATTPAPVVAPPLYGIWMYDPVTKTQQPIVIGEEGVLIADVVAAQPRGNPNSIPDFTPTPGFESDLVAESAGILNIRSVYDMDGAASVNIAAIADPLLTAAAERPARFLRIEKAVSIPDDDIVDLDNTAFGPNIAQGMREIIGYAPIEPDGSVRVKVPANVALAVSVLDQNGRRTSARHQNWLQVLPGQELKCNGCHSPQSNLSHGRSDSFAPAYAGASGTGVPFPNTVGTFAPDAGDTMAEVRTRVSCQVDSCAALVPSVDILFADVWTNPTVRTPDLAFDYSYADLTTDPPVTDSNCLAKWTTRCRIVINYAQHIHPLWAVTGPTRTVGGADVTCSQGGCHSPVNAAVPAVPAGQLDLTDGPSEDEPDQLKSYRELLFADNAQVVMNGALVDEQIQIGTDDMGNPILAPVSVGAAMSSAGARVSTRFFNRFAPGGTHAGYLTDAELKLIAEWLDVGAQYYNNPFDVPVM